MTKLELAHIDLGNFLYTVSADNFIDFNEAVKDARENWHIINDEYKELKAHIAKLGPNNQLPA